jgi:four helix bundle protein
MLYLAVRAYQLTNELPPEEIYNLSHQIKKSVVSIPSNIAEGAGRNSNNEFNQFLGFATSSSYELENQVLLSERLNFLSSEDVNPVIEELHSLQKRIYNFKKFIKKQREVVYSGVLIPLPSTSLPYTRKPWKHIS